MAEAFASNRISKDEAVRLLNENGYKAVYDKGLVLVQWVNDRTYKDVSAFLKSHGYDMSYGVKDLGALAPGASDDHEASTKEDREK